MANMKKRKLGNGKIRAYAGLSHVDRATKIIEELEEQGMDWTEIVMTAYVLRDVVEQLSQQMGFDYNMTKVTEKEMEANR